MNKTALIAVSIISIMAVVFGLAALAIRDSVVTFIVFVIVLIVVLFIGVTIYRIFIEAWLKWSGMKLKHQEAQNSHQYSMLRLQLEHAPKQLQTTAQQSQHIEWKPELEKWRMTGVDYVVLTIDVCGRDSKQLISANKAQEHDAWKGAGTIQHALDFLSGNHLTYVKTSGGKQDGTYIKDDMTAGELMAILSPARLRGLR